MNRRADQHARIVRVRGKHDFDHAEWQADDRTGNLDRRRDDGSGAVESVRSGGDRLAIGPFSHRCKAGVDRMMGPVHNSVVDTTIGQAGRYGATDGDLGRLRLSFACG
jgi:hypothetical protein